MGQYLIDNNAISNFFSGLFTEKGMDFMAEVLDQTPTISVITEIEALSWIMPLLVFFLPKKQLNSLL